MLFSLIFLIVVVSYVSTCVCYSESKKKVQDLTSELELSNSQLELYKEKFKHSEYLLEEMRLQNNNLDIINSDLHVQIYDLKQKLKGKGKK